MQRSMGRKFIIQRRWGVLCVSGELQLEDIKMKTYEEITKDRIWSSIPEAKLELTLEKPKNKTRVIRTGKNEIAVYIGEGLHFFTFAFVAGYVKLRFLKGGRLKGYTSKKVKI
jgi:hypothetical protein